MLETHPYLDQGKIRGATGLIIGTFPVWQCTNPDSIEKAEMRNKTGTHRFFYGSSRNNFWKLYNKNFDNLNDDYSVKNILESLKISNIAVSDLIVSASRNIPKSASDSDLREITWNTNEIHSLIESGTHRILCTSKGVLNKLSNKVLAPSKNPFAEVNKKKSNELSKLILGAVHDKVKVKRPIATVFETPHGIVEAIAIPSPGGNMYRRLQDFGLTEDLNKDKQSYLDLYFKVGFKFLRTGFYTEIMIDKLATTKEELIDQINNTILTQKALREIKNLLEKSSGN